MEKLYCPCSENKGADQLSSNVGFLMMQLIFVKIMMQNSTVVACYC